MRVLGEEEANEGAYNLLSRGLGLLAHVAVAGNSTAA